MRYIRSHNAKTQTLQVDLSQYCSSHYRLAFTFQKLTALEALTTPMRGSTANFSFENFTRLKQEKRTFIVKGQEGVPLLLDQLFKIEREISA
jgi:hypothetical protein